MTLWSWKLLATMAAVFGQTVKRRSELALKARGPRQGGDRDKALDSRANSNGTVEVPENVLGGVKAVVTIPIEPPAGRGRARLGRRRRRHQERPGPVPQPALQSPSEVPKRASRRAISETVSIRLGDIPVPR